MRKLVIILAILGLMGVISPNLLLAADSKMIDLTADTSPSESDIIYTTKDPGGSPLDRKVTLGAAVGVARAPIALAADTAAPNITPGAIMNTNNSGDLTYTNFLCGGAACPSGTRFTLIVQGSSPKSTFNCAGSNFICNGASDYDAADGDKIEAISVGGILWYLDIYTYGQVVPLQSSAVSGVVCADGSGNLANCSNLTDTAVAISITTSGLTAGRAYYVSAANTYTAADATSAATLPSPAICVAVSTTVCQVAGTYTTTGLTAGAVYYVPVGGGAITATAPSSSGNIIQRIGVALSTTVLQIIPSLDVMSVL